MPVRIWYIYSIRDALRDVGVAGTQVVSRVRSLAELAPVTVLSVEGNPQPRDWQREVFPDGAATATPLARPAGSSRSTCSARTALPRHRLRT